MNESICLQVGIDWADKKHDYCMYETENQRYHSDVISSSPDCVHKWINQLRLMHPSGTIQVCVELSRGPLIEILQQYSFIDIYPLNPITAKRMREALYPSLTKDDPMDAKLILEILQKHIFHLRKLTLNDQDIILLRGLVEARRSSVNRRRSIVQEMISVLKLYYPQAIEMVGDFHETMTYNFLRRWPDWESLQKARPQTLRKFYYAHQSRSETRIAQRLELQAKSTLLTNNQATIEVGKIKMLTLLELLHTQEKGIREYDKKINDLYKQMDKHYLLDSFPGAGKALAPRLMVALSCYTDYCESSQDLAAYSGIAPLKQASGNSWKISKRFRVPHFLHQTFYEFAQWSRRYSVWAKSYYRYRKEVIRESHQSIIRKLAFKWIRILFKCWQDNTAYDEDRYLEILKQKGQSPWLTI